MLLISNGTQERSSGSREYNDGCKEYWGRVDACQLIPSFRSYNRNYRKSSSSHGKRMERYRREKNKWKIMEIDVDILVGAILKWWDDLWAETGSVSDSGASRQDQGRVKRPSQQFLIGLLWKSSDSNHATDFPDFSVRNGEISLTISDKLDTRIVCEY